MDRILGPVVVTLLVASAFVTPVASATPDDLDTNVWTCEKGGARYNCSGVIDGCYYEWSDDDTDDDPNDENSDVKRKICVGGDPS